MATAEQFNRTSLADKAITYIDDEAENLSMTRRNFLIMLVGTIGLEVTGALYVADIIEHGGQSRMLTDISHNLHRQDIPNEAQSTLEKFPLLMGAGTLALLTKQSVDEFAQQGGGRRAFLKLLFHVPRNLAYATVATGAGFFIEPTVIGSAAEDYFKDKKDKQDKFNHAVSSIQNMATETLNNTQSHISLDNYSGVARQNILLTTKYLRDAFASDDPVRRIAAKHVFAWMCLSPTDDKSVYKTYFHDLLPLDPRERYISSDDQRKVQLFVETLDSVTSGIDQEINDKKLTFSDSQVADAMVEATFRTFALVIDPESNMWSVNEFTLSAASYTAQGNVVRTSNHDLVFKPFSIGDIPVQSNTPINFLLDTHN